MERVRIAGGLVERQREILTPEALEFVAELHSRFADRRDELLRARASRRARIAANPTLDFLPSTAAVRTGDWQVAPAPADLTDRRVEITGPCDRKMAINALNSGARVWLADLEDASSPTWANVIGGQVNLADAIRRTIEFDADGKSYRLASDRRLATIVMRPRGWHLPEKHLIIDGRPAVGALVDFGLYFFHNAAELIARGTGPYFYLPKMEAHEEARLWNDVFTNAQVALGIPYGTVRATVLIETITAAFEMEEILYELRDHASGLNAGRWDYLFSLIKTFRDAGASFVLPDRAAVAMTAPMMRAYTDLLVHTCHKRGALAIGGMAAFIPSRRDPEVNATALAKVRQDKQREAGDGFDGSWVAHPDLVPICQEVFDDALGDAPNQLNRLRPDASADAAALLDVAATPGTVTLDGVRSNVAVGLRYLDAWLGGLGAVAIFNLMEDAATAEISRSQIWQWVHNDTRTADGTPITPDLVRAMIAEESDGLQHTATPEIFEAVALAQTYVDFLTIPAYEHLA